MQQPIVASQTGSIDEVPGFAAAAAPAAPAAPASAAGQALAGVADALAERIAKEHFDRAGGETAPDGEGPKRLRILR